MGDSWRFDPNKDYMADDEDNGRNNFQRFKNKKGKNKKKSFDDEDYQGKKHGKHSNWR